MWTPTPEAMATHRWLAAAMFLLLLLSVKAIESQAKPRTFQQQLSQFIGQLRRGLADLVDSDGEEVYSKLSSKQKNQIQVPDTAPFPCDLTHARSPTRPTSVNKVRPGDIDIVGAIGDSLTTANGAAATNVLLVAEEHRELSWSIGGASTWRRYLTLPNILKVFNPNLIGYSSSRNDSGFNVAELGTASRDTPYMTRVLVRRMMSDPRVDLEKDWKLVTIMIGANDFCTNFCFLNDEAFYQSHQKLRRHLTISLDYLKDHLPRTIVNLVLPPGMDGLRVFDKQKGFCHSMHAWECPCFFGHMRTKSYEENVAMQRKWMEVEEELAADERYQKEDFAVIAQTFMKGFRTPMIIRDNKWEPDITYLAEDCFHFSQKGHAAAANALWNNMLEPAGHKTTHWIPPFERFLCPTREFPFIFTMGNEPRQGDSRSEM